MDPESTRTKRTQRAKLYAAARLKKAAGKPLSYAERQRLDEARDFRVAREEASVRRDEAYELRGTGPRFLATQYGWRVLIPENTPGGPWVTRSEIEIVAPSGRRMWVTLIKMYATGGGEERCGWWSYLLGRQSLVEQHVPPPVQPLKAPPDIVSGPYALDEEDSERVTTAAGAAYLALKKKKTRKVEDGP